MSMFPIPTSADQYEYLLRLYFGRKGDPLSRCINRAYRDFNRTMHGFAEFTEGGLHAEGSEVVRSYLLDLVAQHGALLDQPAFDKRHLAACTKLRKTYSNGGFPDFHDGQGQKWLNMALKYVFVFGENRLPGYARVFELAHIPLDNIILKKFYKPTEPYKRACPHLEGPWSRMSYDEYMPIQDWVRDPEIFSGSAPLAVEFHLFQNSDDSASPDD